MATWKRGPNVGIWCAVLLAITAAVAQYACIGNKSLPGIATVEAQSLPVTRVVGWDANPATDNVQHYTVRLNGAVIGQPTATTQAVTFTDVGDYTVTVTATNEWGESLPGTLLVRVILPGKPNNLVLQPPPATP